MPMSRTMFLGRVLLPGFGLLLATVLFWQALRSVTAVGAPEITMPQDASSGTAAASAHPGAGAGAGAGAHAAPALAPGTIVAEGRVVAETDAEVTVGTEVLGTIVNMPVREKSVVHKGELIAELRSDPVRAALRKAKLVLVEAESRLRAEQERARRELLMPTFADRASGLRPDMPAAIAHRDTAKADVEALEAELARYRILAPIDGTVVTRHAGPGATVGPAAPLVTIVNLNRLRVEAEVDEFDIDRVTLGAEATIAAEGARSRRWRVRVVQIADAVVPRQTRPEDPSRPSDTRILPVWLVYREPNPLKLGQRVEIEIAGANREP